MSDIENAQDSKELALLEMLSLVYEEMDLDTIEERFVNLTADIFGFDRVGLFFVKHRKGVLQGKLCKGFDPGIISSLEIPLNGKSIFIKPLITGFPLISSEEPTDPHTQKLGIHDFALIPIVNKKRLSCWQIKKCTKADCPAYGKKWLRCWLVPGTKCGNIPLDDCDRKEEMCRECEVFAKQDSDTAEGVIVVDNSTSKKPIAMESITLLSIVAHAVGGAICNAKVYSRTLRESIRDELTELYNRRFFNERLVDEVDRARRYGGIFSLLFCDIDHFKEVNDTFGHPTGDKVLVRIANILRENIRSSDMVARYGGEEFTILLLNTDKNLARTLAEQICRAIAAAMIPEIDGRQVTVSIGLATFNDDSISFEGLMAKADRAMYLAKNKGRNQVIAL
ncbi:MAG: GGDEF domain-containing protein [Desulfobulbaceae bacterium]|nr:GGDEF domain-containing protein [Desulfobulbaceae bacterium]